MSKIQAVFFDRDGTLGEGYIDEHPWEIVPFPYAAEVISKLKVAGIKVFIFTNQSCIARKKDGGYDFAAEFEALGADDWFICPHDDADGCGCRKPKPGLLLAAREKYGLDLSACFAVGDRWTDIACGLPLGVRGILVLTGRGKRSLERQPAGAEAEYVCADIRSAADYILEELRKDRT